MVGVSLFVASLLASSLADPLEKRTVTQIESDLGAISIAVNKLDTDLNNFPDSGGSLLAALGLHTDATTLDDAIKVAVSDTLGTPTLSEADGQAILLLVQGIEPVIIDALNVVATKKPALQALPISGIPALAKSDLNALNTDTQAFENALLGISPPDLVPQANTIIAAINAAFAKATAAYADVTQC